MWPVIPRELRASSRHRGTFYLRMLAAGAAVFTCSWFTFVHSVAIGEGARIFQLLHLTLLATIAILVPLMSMDCISRERREGTLGLLFMTNLRATHIIFAKLAAHGLRALTLWLAIIPVMALPLLMGGVDWRLVALSSLFALETVLVSLLVGVVVSALTRGWLSAMVLVVIFMSGTAITFIVGNAFAILVGLQLSGAVFNDFDVDQAFSVLGFNEGWDWLVSSSTPAKWKRGFVIGQAVFLLALIGYAVIVFVGIAAYLRRSWQDKIKTRRQQQVENTFCKPVVAQGLLRTWMRRSLQRNPIGWLERRSWVGRIAGWIWLGIIISFASSFATYHGQMADLFYGIMWLLLASLAYVAAGSFRRERETGALELILVTPLKEWAIVWGRLWGVWGIFLPSFLVWGAVLVYSFSWTREWEMGRVTEYLVSFIALPIIGLYFSLRSRVVLVAWLSTLAAGIFLPRFFYSVGEIILRLAIKFLVGAEGYVPLEEWWMPDWLPWMRMPIELFIAALLLWRLHLLLVRRTFSFRLA